MWRISKAFHFAAAHHLTGMKEGHPCARPHGHNYTVTLILEGAELQENGILVDYSDLTFYFGRMIDDCVDHRDLNVVFDFNPTAENLAREFYRLAAVLPFGRLVQSVMVQETDKTAATYYAVRSKTMLLPADDKEQLVVLNGREEQDFLGLRPRKQEKPR